MRSLLILTLALAAAPALAQQTEEEARASATILPMLQEVAPGRDGAVLAACVVAEANPAETAAMATAPGPSAELGTLVSTILARPATLGCVQATLGG